jgi:bacitracin transport system permease protein
MLYGVLVSEALKYKRTLIPWLVLVGGFFPVLVASLFLLTGGSSVTWEALAGTSFNFMNMLALLLVAVIAGHAFVTEYNESRINKLFAYPVPRIVFYLVKLLVVLLAVLGMYLVFLAFAAVSGWLMTGGGLPEPGFAADMPRLLLLTAAANFSLAPLTAVLCMMLKNDGAYILAGIGYFIFFMSFAGSEYGQYILPCIPDKLLQDYLTTGQLMSANTGSLLAICAAAFLILSGIGAACYVWQEH